jgi:hypothetical protein
MRRISLILLLTLFAILVSDWLPTRVDSAVPGSRTILLTQTPLTYSSFEVAQNNSSPTQNRPYALTVLLPEHQGHRFSQLSLTALEEPGTPSILFNLDKTRAYYGKPDERGAEVTVHRTWIDETGTLWVEFNPAIAPNTSLTLIFDATDLTPGKPHQFGVAAYPDMPNTVAVWVGNQALETQW